MTGIGEPWLVSRALLDAAVRGALESRQVVAPARVRDQVRFRPISGPEEVVWDYAGTMLPASKVLYAPEQDLLRLARASGGWETAVADPAPRPRVLLAVHPCDVHGILVLDRTLLGAYRDPGYESARRETLIVGLNCQQIGRACFCASFGTGPFFHAWMGQGPPQGSDLLLTDLGDGRFLAESMTPAGRAFLPERDLAPAGPADLASRDVREAAALARFRKKLDIRQLPALLMRNLEHAIWERVGEGRCLSCTNCTMVCPTCYCYAAADEVAMDLRDGRRCRRWDSCQDQHFAQVHFGNYRATRKSRLRQFVCHKLCYWTEQYGCFGCVGCGRCMSWCPTEIDLAEIATEIREDEDRRCRP
jgi:ferredoxin